MKIKAIILMAAVLLLCGAMHAQATLLDRGNGMIYDDDIDITWYDFAYASESWDDAMTWASDLTVTVGGATYDDWRLPSAGADPQFGENQIDTEMGHLYYTELGNEAWDLTMNFGPFTTLTRNPYWTGTESSEYNAWVFGFASGRQLNYSKGWDLPAMAVRTGDVGVNQVPEPTSLLLMGVGMMGVAMLKRKRR